MPRKKQTSAITDRWMENVDQFRSSYPHLGAFLLSGDDFVELRLKNRDDGTVLGIAKGYGPDGGPVVCFGVGYDICLALMALDSTIQGGHWKTDKPWQPPRS